MRFPENFGLYDREILAAANRWRVPPGLLKACAWAESEFKPGAVRKEPHLGDESRGLMQLLTATAKDLGEDNPEALWNPGRNLDLGAKYLRRLYECFWEIPEATTERWRFAVAAYNAGRGRVNKALARAREATAANLYEPGLWAEWWFAREFLDGDHDAEGKSEGVTKRHIDRVWAYWSEILMAGNFREGA